MAACTTLRHNRGMPPIRLACLLPAAALGLALSGCDRPPVATPADATMPAAADGERIAWRARLPCADCDGIDTTLQLQQDGRMRVYTLSETYLAGGGGERFVEHGHWQRRHAWLQLQGDDGARRRYALLADGGLQATDSRGRALSGDAGRILVPVTAAPAP